MDLQAVRSLLCEDHAHNLPPRVKTISWFLGKRCNYDCSYCSAHVHDAVSAFVDRQRVQDFIARADEYGQQHDCQLKWNFTGGEPFLDPAFLPMLEQLSACLTTYQINSITNGSLPLTVYRRAAQLSKGITFSLHLERSESEVSVTVDKILQLAADGDAFVAVNLMLLPGRLPQVQQIIQQFKRHDVSFVIRKISPPEGLEELAPYRSQGTGKKDWIMLDLDQQAQQKILWRKRNDDARQRNIDSYYSAEEHAFLQDVNLAVLWNNMGIWTTDGYQEINSDLLIARQANSFLGWTCYAGVDHINIDFDGKIYSAQCQNNGAVGHIDDGVIFANDPAICGIRWCTCNTDIPIRKARDVMSLERINDRHIL